MEKAEITKFGVRGWLTARIKRLGSDKFEELWRIPVKNTIVNNGLAQMALLWNSGTGFTLGRIGSGSTGPTITDSALEAQLDSQAGTFSRITTTVANDTAQLVSTHTAPVGGWTVREYGAFNAGSVMYNRVVFSAITLAETEQLQFTYKSQVTRA